MNDRRELHRWSKQVVDDLQSLGRQVSNLQRIQAALTHKHQMDAAQALLEKLQSHSVSYSNLIIAVGYAGFFALWNLLDDDLPRALHSAAGLLILLSLVTFISWEVTKMIWSAIHLNRIQRELLSSQPRIDAIGELQDALARHDRRTYGLWPWFLIPTVAFGLAAGASLLGFFVVDLLKYLHR